MSQKDELTDHALVKSSISWWCLYVELELEFLKHRGKNWSAVTEAELSQYAADVLPLSDGDAFIND